jgi:hypothetical protein
LGCTAFASCGVVTLLDSGIKGVRVTISTRNLPKLRTGVSKRTIHKVQEDPDFPVLAASYANYFSQFQKELIKQKFSEGRQAKGQRTHGSFVDGLVKNLKGATTAFIEK